MELQNVICNTTEQFHAECKKWSGKSVIRGRKLIAYGQTVAELVTNRGGIRPGAGRPSKVKGLSVALSVRITPEANEILSKVSNKSEYIDHLIKMSVQ